MSLRVRPGERVYWLGAMKDRDGALVIATTFDKNAGYVAYVLWEHTGAFSWVEQRFLANDVRFG